MCLRFSNDLRADCHDPLPYSGLILFNSMQAKGLAATEFDSLLAPAVRIAYKRKLNEGGVA